MPPKGPTQRTVARLEGRYFRSSARLERFDGRLNDLDRWTPVGTYSCRVSLNSSQAADPMASSQDYDTEVILVTPPVVGGSVSFPRTARYRLYVEEYKTELEATNAAGPPEVKRTAYYEAARISVLTAVDGSDLFAVLNCRNAKPWPATAT